MWGAEEEREEEGEEVVVVKEGAKVERHGLHSGLVCAPLFCLDEHIYWC